MNVIAQIADEVGVSQATVTRALSRAEPYVRPSCAKRAERIRQLAVKRGYRINAAAKAMSTGRFHTVGCLHSSNLDATSSYQPQLIASMHMTLEENDFYVTSAYLSDDRLTNTATFPKFVRELAVDGLLIDYATKIPELARNLINHCQRPAIWLNVKYDTNCVYPDDVAAGRIATEHLLELGHTKIAYGEFAITTHYSHTDRLEGYRQAMQAAGLEPVVVKPKVEHQGTRLEMARTILGQIERPTAFVTPSPGSCNPLIAATVAHGWEVGKDIAFVTVNQKMDYAVGVQLTTVVIPFREVGEIGARRLMEQIDDPSRICPAIPVAPALERGDSTMK